MKIFKLFFRLFIFIFAVLLIIGLALYIYAKASPKILINSANNITLYDKSDNVFFKGNEKKEWVSLDEISPYLIQSTIYTEDKYFYKHFGF